MVVIILAIGVVISVLLTSHYERVVHHVSQNQLEATTSNLSSSLNLFLKQPFDASYSIAYAIKANDLYRKDDTSDIQQYIHSSLKALYGEVEHLDVIGFGGKHGEFVGFRRNKDDSYALMLKDGRTTNNLIIYKGDNTQSGTAAMTTGYDPRTRPWYTKFSQPKAWKPAWSPIYVNSDEKQETTLSALQPLVIDEKLFGVLVADIKLDTFNQFLLESRRLTQSHFFIFDDKYRLVAHSESSSTSSQGQRLHISDSPTALNQAISQALLEKYEHISNFDQVFEVRTNYQRYFVKLTPYGDEKGLNWFVVTAISESNLLGTLWYSQMSSLVTALLIMTLAILVAVFVFDRVTSPIIDTAAAARSLAKGDLQAQITTSTRITETRQLVETFNDMALNLDQSFQELRKQITHDSLTLLYSRVGFIQESENRPSTDATLYVMGLNNFKRVNLTYGHSLGDKVLSRIANRLRHLLGSSEFIGRVAADEFALLRFDDTTEYDFQLMVSRLQQAFKTPISIEQHKIKIDISVGIVRSCSSSDMDQWLRKGSIALSLAQKEQVPVNFYHEQMSAEHQRKAEMRDHIRRGLANGEFVPYYQPIVDLESNRIVGAEALARWHSSYLGLVSPIEFIPIAEDSGLINEIGRQILFCACRDGVRGIQQGLWGDDFHMHVNVSVTQLRQIDFAQVVLDTIKQTQFPPEQLTLEITESQILESNPDVTENLKQIYKSGIKIAIDDFGTGYSSLAYLHKLPFSTLKIDRSFVSELSESNADSSIVSAIINIIDGFEVTVVAEGVETLEQQSVLKHLKCSQAQGYLYSRPKPFDEWRLSHPLNEENHLS